MRMTTPSYTINLNTDSATKSLEELPLPLLSWFKENKLELNFDKSHLNASGIENAKIKHDEFNITNSKKEKLLGIIFDNRLGFQFHIENLRQKESLKLSALLLVAPVVGLSQKKILFNTLFQSQFSYCPLVWLCHSKILNNKINRLHKRCLRLMYDDKHSIFH